MRHNDDLQWYHCVSSLCRIAMGMPTGRLLSHAMRYPVYTHHGLCYRPTAGHTARYIAHTQHSIAMRHTAMQYTHSTI